MSLVVVQPRVHASAQVLVLACLAAQQAAQGQPKKSTDVLVRFQLESGLHNCTVLNTELQELADSVGVDLSKRSVQCSHPAGGNFQQSILVNSSELARSLASLEADWATFTHYAQVPCGSVVRVSTQTAQEATPVVYLFSCDASASTANITRLGQTYHLHELCCQAPPPPESPLAPPPPSPGPPPPKPKIRKRSSPVDVPQLVLDIFLDPAQLDCSALIGALTTIAPPYGLDGGMINCTLVTPRVNDPVAALNPSGGVSAPYLSVSGAWLPRQFNRIVTRMQQTLGASIDAFVTLGPIPCGAMLRGTLRDSSAVLKATQVFTCSIAPDVAGTLAAGDAASDPELLGSSGSAVASTITQAQADSLAVLDIVVITRRVLCCRSPPPGSNGDMSPPSLPPPPQLPSEPDMPPMTPLPSSPSIYRPPPEDGDDGSPPGAFSAPPPPSKHPASRDGAGRHAQGSGCSCHDHALHLCAACTLAFGALVPRAAARTDAWPWPPRWCSVWGE